MSWQLTTTQKAYLQLIIQSIKKYFSNLFSCFLIYPLLSLSSLCAIFWLCKHTYNYGTVVKAFSYPNHWATKCLLILRELYMCQGFIGYLYVMDIAITDSHLHRHKSLPVATAYIFSYAYALWYYYIAYSTRTYTCVITSI